MKNLKIFMVFTLSIIFLFTNCNRNIKENPTADIKFYLYNISQEKVREIAARHGFTNETITDKQRKTYPELTYIDSTILTCCSEKYLNMEYANLKNMFDKDKVYANERAIFDEKKYFVTSLKEYYDLINSLPMHKASAIAGNGGEVNYLRYVDSIVKVPMHIYIGTDGVLTFIEPHLDNNFDTPNGKYNGKRLDKMKE